MQRIQEGALIFSSVIALFLLLALLSFDPADPAWSQTGQHAAIKNSMGAVGAQLADIMLFAFGWVAYAVPVSVALAGWFAFKRFSRILSMDFLTLGLRLIGVVMIILSATTISSINFDDIYDFSSGGVVGDIVKDAMIPYFSYTGTSLLLLCFLFTGITLTTGLSWLAVIDAIGDGVLYLWHRLTGFIEAKSAQPDDGKAARFDAIRDQSEDVLLGDVEQDDSPALVKRNKKESKKDIVGNDTAITALDKTSTNDLSPGDILEPKITLPDSVSDDEPPFTLDDDTTTEPKKPDIHIPLQDVVIKEDMDDEFFNVEALVQEERKNAEELSGSDFFASPDDEPAPPQAPASSGNELLDAIEKVKQRKLERANMPPLPTLELLDKPQRSKNPVSEEDLERVARLVEVKLLDFNIQANVVGVYPGPVITRFELDLAPGIKVSKISGLAKDLARALSAISVRVVEVIPGKSVIGLELPNKYRETVSISETLASEEFKQSKSPLSMVLGADISGQPVVVDLAKMPHLLVAGTTGSGKSVGVNTMLISLLYKSSPEDVRMILIDPKMLELSVYEGIPHLLSEVVTDMKEAANALRWCVGEMERRYKLMSALGVRNLKGYNEKVQRAIDEGNPLSDPLWKPSDSMDEEAPKLGKLYTIVVVIDEFADMMMIVGKKVEELIARIAQKARAAGIHLILATQRPSVDVITGLIKANIPTRIAFQVSSRIDSRTILDQQGAENLLGQGDMLYLPPGSGVPTRVHGAFVADHEVHAVVEDWKKREEPQYIDEILSGESAEEILLPGEQPEGADDDTDELYDQAVAFVTETRRASVSGVQRKFRIGYNRAARIVEQMEVSGVVSAPGHNGNREVIAPPPVK